MSRGGHTLPPIRFVIPGLLLLVFASLFACAEPRRAPDEPVEAVVSRVDVFLTASNSASRLQMTVEGVRLIDVDGEEHVLSLLRPLISSTEAGFRLAIAGGIVPPDRYRAIVLEVRRAVLVSGGQDVLLRLLPHGQGGAETGAPSDFLPGSAGDERAVSYRFPVDLRIGRHHAASLFLDWNVEGSLADGGFRPALSTSLETGRARLGMLYVTDAATGSILVFDRSSERIVGTGKVGAGPRALAISRDRRRLYVANEGDGSLSIVDTGRNFDESTIPVRMSARTSDVIIADAGRSVATTNPGLDTVSFFDVRDRSRVDDVRVGRSPVRLVAAPLLRRVFVVNAKSDDLSVIEMGTREVVATVPVESTPSTITLDRNMREVFVGHEVSRNLLVLDASSLLPLASVYVGGDVTALLADRRRDRVFVARSNPPEVAIVDRRLAAVVRRIPVSGVIENLAQPAEGPFIYGACPERGGLVIVDVIVGEEKELLPCGTTPTDVVAID